MRPITLEDEDFIKNINKGSTALLKSPNVEKNGQTMSHNEEEAEWDDILTPSQAQNRTATQDAMHSIHGVFPNTQRVKEIQPTPQDTMIKQPSVIYD